jgi:hypothetical protein
VLLSAFLFKVMVALTRGGDRFVRATIIFVGGFLTLSLTEMTIFAAATGTIIFFILAGAAVARAVTVPGFDSHDTMESAPGPSSGTARVLRAAN